MAARTNELRRQALSVPEAAEVLGISPRAAWRYARTGELPTVRLGGRVLVPVRLLEELLSGVSPSETSAPGFDRARGALDTNEYGQTTPASG
jgi:excisionase family DNA binding protein